MSATQTIFVVAAVIRDAEGRVLLVRKRSTQAFMFPGGKKEEDEDDLTGLSREIREELGCLTISADFIGLFQAPAANEPGATIEAAVYEARVLNMPSVLAELEEMLWVDPASPPAITLAPLVKDFILPLIAKNNFIQYKIA